MRAVDASVETPVASPAPEAPEIRDAATVILVSDRAVAGTTGLHVLMLERTGRAVFGPGATVFPGGAVDADDRAVRSQNLVVDLDDAAASLEHGIAHGGLAFRVAALRECFEEAGILLAHDAATGRPVEHDAGLAADRVRLNAGSLRFTEMLETRSLALAARELRLFSHWLTPLGAPRRYNTWFFVAPAPEGEDGTHDDNELVASGWVRPLDALALHAAGEIDLIFPTEMSLRALAHYDQASDVIDDLDSIERDARGGLRVVSDGTGERVALPADSGRALAPWTIPLPDISFRAERAAAGEVSA